MSPQETVITRDSHTFVANVSHSDASDRRPSLTNHYKLHAMSVATNGPIRVGCYAQRKDRDLPASPSVHLIAHEIVAASDKLL